MLNDREQSLKLLNETHTFPTEMTFKVIGNNTDEFPERVVACVRDTLSLETDPEFSSRSTENARHISITVEPKVQNAEEVLEVYDRLKEVEGVVMLL